MPVGDVGALRGDGGAMVAGHRLLGFRGRHQRHASAHHQEGTEKEQPQHQEPALGPHPGAVLHLGMAQADIFALDGVGVLALVAGRQDPSQRAQRDAGHGRASAAMVETSTGLVIGNSGAGG